MLCAPVHLGQLPLSSPITNSSTRSGLLSPGMGQVQGFGSGKELKKSQGPCHCQFIGRHPQRTDSSASGPKGDRSTHPRAEPQLHPKCPVHGIPNSHVPLVHEGLSPGSELPQMRNGGRGGEVGGEALLSSCLDSLQQWLLPWQWALALLPLFSTSLAGAGAKRGTLSLLDAYTALGWGCGQSIAFISLSL